MTTVLIFGTFDLFHKGHEYLLEKASQFGDELYVLISRDATVKKLKKQDPLNSEQKRLERIKALPHVKEAFLGSTTDHFSFLNRLVPDIICLGYDQTFLVDRLKEEILKRKLATKLVVLDAHHPKTYKSSLLRKKLSEESL